MTKTTKPSMADRFAAIALDQDGIVVMSRWHDAVIAVPIGKRTGRNHQDHVHFSDGSVLFMRRVAPHQWARYRANRSARKGR